MHGCLEGKVDKTTNTYQYMVNEIFVLVNSNSGLSVPVTIFTGD